MRINVFGAGGVGGYLAARLAASGAAEVSVIARGRHLDAIRRNGLRLDSPAGGHHVQVSATDDPGAIGQVDVVLLAVKSTDVPSAVTRIVPLIGASTAVITLQNGIDAPDTVAATIGEEHVLPGVAYLFSTVTAPGVVSHTAGPGRIVFGGRSAATAARAVEVGAFLTAAGVANEVVDEVDVALWSKLALICATAGVTAASRLPIDVLREDPASNDLFRQLAGEAVAVGRAAGVALPADTVDHTMAFIASIGAGAYSSLLYDLVNGKPMELDALHGAVLRLADVHGVEVPATRTVHGLLSAWAQGDDRSRDQPLASRDGTRVLAADHSPDAPEPAAATPPVNGTGEVITTFLRCGEAAAQLLQHDDVGRAWSRPSALTGYDVAGLAGHLARAVITVERYLDTPLTQPSPTLTDAAGYFATVLADADPVDSELHRAIRDRSAATASGGQSALVGRLRDAVARMRVILGEADTSTVIEVRDGLVLPLAEYLATRIVELVVHIDDLAVSIDRSPPELPESAYLITASVLARTAVLRVDGPRTVRALARPERHTGRLSAF
jgi:2-dehydropantoate 2-reductase